MKPSSRGVVLILALVTGLTGTSTMTACKKRGGDASADKAAVSDAIPFTVSDSSEGLLFTWIDERGDFHVEQRAADVPLVGRDAVRVVDPSRDEGTHPERVFVADLRTAQPDGTYLVKPMTKADFEEMAVSRRKGKSALLEPKAPGPVASGGQGPAAANGPNGGGEPADPNARPAVIIYGAEWCGPCHQAAAYLRKKGIPFVEKNIEADRDAAREMQAKLAKAGLHDGSIPVLDVRGKMMVGFNPRAVDEALGAAM
ncbi:glutaredoxin family protein [Pendulispora brunnea]|uniref:Glutaredoxin family protein n=1 Tax=Pendulispora brunnea TaxID=2905690 RepID=A0ABZ2JZQ4_9BACT